MVYVYNGIGVSLKKEGSSSFRHSMNEPIHHFEAKQGKHRKTSILMLSHLCGIKESQIYRNRRMIVARGQGCGTHRD